MSDVLRASRVALIESIVAGAGEAHLVCGPLGIGKTELLDELGARLGDRRCTVLRIDVPDQAEAGESAGRPPQAFRQCLGIALQIGDQLAAMGEPKLSRTIGALIRRAQFNPITVNQSITATDSGSVQADSAQSVELNWGEHLVLMDSLLGDEVVTAVSQRMRRFTVAVLMDDIHNLEGTRGQEWLLDVLRRIRGARLVATQRSSVVPSAVARVFFSRHRLDPLPRDDVAAYLAGSLDIKVTGFLVDLVCAATGRLPWGVRFVAERLIRSPDMTRQELEEVLESAKVSSDLVDLVDASLTRLPPELRRALDRLVVLRDFDQRAAAHMLTADDDPGALLAELRQAFVLEITPRNEHGRNRSSDPTDSGVCMHLPDIVRAAVSRQNVRRDPYQATALHQQAAAFYRAAVEGAGAGLDDPFGRWSAIEGGVAQRYLSEWIYHLANAGPAITRHDRARILRWYFEGFFWYEWKVAHWFCQRLLEYCEAVRRTNTVKFFADGIVENGTALLLEDYCDGPRDTGMAVWDPVELRDAVAAFDADGFQVHVHAIGDGGVRMALDAIEHARGNNVPWQRRPVVSHVQLVSEQDLFRFAALGVIANFQPYWAQYDDFQRFLTEPRLGDRSTSQFPLASMLATGARMSFGSDWPVSSLHPMEGIQVAVTRPIDDRPAKVWLPEECLTVPQALRVYTAGAAYQAGAEKLRGIIAPGMVADLVCLAENPFRVAPADLASVAVQGTWLAGRCTYRAHER